MSLVSGHALPRCITVNILIRSIFIVIGAVNFFVFAYFPLLKHFGFLLCSRDPEGLRVFYYLVQDLKCLVFSLIGLHFKIKPI